MRLRQNNGLRWDGILAVVFVDRGIGCKEREGWMPSLLCWRVLRCDGILAVVFVDKSIGWRSREGWKPSLLLAVLRCDGILPSC